MLGINKTLFHRFFLLAYDYTTTKFGMKALTCHSIYLDPNMVRNDFSVNIPSRGLNGAILATMANSPP